MPHTLPFYMQALVDAQKLPLGHTGRKKAQERLSREYALVHQREQELFKQWLPAARKRKRLRSLSYDQAVFVLDTLSDTFGERKVKLLEDQDMFYRVAAYYKLPDKIFVPRTEAVHTLTLLHEFAHHLQHHNRMREGGDHGKGFLLCLELVFQAMGEMEIAKQLLS